MAKFVKIYNGFLKYAHAAIIQVQTPSGRRIVLDKSDPRELTEMLTDFLNDHNHSYEILDDGTLSLQVQGDDGEIGRLVRLKHSDFDPVIKTYALNFFNDKGWTRPAALLKHELQLIMRLETETRSVKREPAVGYFTFSKKDNVVEPVTAEEIRNIIKADDSAWILKINDDLRIAAREGLPIHVITLPSEALTLRMCELYSKEGFICSCQKEEMHVILKFNLSALRDECL